MIVIFIFTISDQSFCMPYEMALPFSVASLAFYPFPKEARVK